MESSETEHWNEYWRSGSITSFAGRFQANYEGSIAHYWADRARKFPPRGKILDMAAGNGAVAMLLAEASRRHGLALEIHAADAAEIHPPRQALNEASDPRGVRFWPACPNEATGFEDASFDVVCSQFGFEYGRSEDSLNELARILRPGCEAYLLCHHPDSIILRDAREEAGLADRVLSERGLIALAKALSEKMGEHPSRASLRALADNPGAESLRQGLNQEVAALQALARSEAGQSALRQWLDSVASLFGPAVEQPLTRKHQALETLSNSIRQNRKRLADLISVAVDENRLAQYRNHPGLRLEHNGAFHEKNNRLLARELVLKRL